MQPAANPEDIRAILSRFHTWAEKNPVQGDSDGNGHGNGAGNGHAAAGSEELREISYEEAIRKHRDRGAAKMPKRAAAASAPTTPVARRPARVKAEPEPRMEVFQGLPVEPAQELSVAPPILKPPAVETQPRPVPAPVHAENAPEDRTPLATAFEQITAAIERNEKISRPEYAPAVKTAKTEKLAKSEAPAAAAGKIVAGISSAVAATNSIVAETSPAAAQTTATPAAKTAAAPRTPKVQRKAGRRPARAKIAAMAKMPLTREAITAALAAKPQSRPVTKVGSALIKPPIVAGIKASARIAAPRKSAAPAVAQRRNAKHPPFHQVLAYSVQQPRQPVAKKKQAEPDRNRRITTRFSTAEERRIAKHAALAGLTVSAYLRKCALSVVASTQSARSATPASAPAKRRRQTAPQAPSYQDYQYVEPTSLLGSWLALLRNRFLPPPVRYSGQA